MKLTIKGIDYKDKLLARSLRINKELADQTASFSLLLQPEEIADIDITNEIKIGHELTKEGSGFLITFNLFGGVITEINYENYKDAIRVNISCSSYNVYASRFYVSETLPIEPKPDSKGVDRNYAGVYIRELVTKYLASEGITAGDIQDGAVLTENTISDYYQTPLNEIFDTLADLSAYKWFIDGNKQLNFAEILKTVDKFPEPITAQNPLYRDITYRKELTNYRNNQIVIGDLPVEDIPELNYDPETGKLRTKLIKQEEVDRLIAMNGGTGVWTNKLEDSKIVTLSDASKVTDKQLNDYGIPPTYFEFSTDIEKIQVEAGDSFTVNIPFYGIDNENFIAESVEINDWLVGKLQAVVKGSLRDTTSPRGNLFDWLKGIKRDISNVPKLVDRAVGKTDPGNGVNRNGLISWITTDTATIVGSGGKVLRISDKNNGGYHVAQPYPDKQPSVVSMMGSTMLEFDGTQSMGFESNIKNSRTVFIVYQDLTKDDNSKDGRIFMDGTFSGGTSFQGGSAFDNNVFGSVAINKITQSWVNTVKIAPASVTRYRSDFVVLAFTLSEDMSVNKFFTSGIVSDTFKHDGSLPGRFLEFLVYNRVLTDSEMNEMNNYLYGKHFK